MRCEFIVDALTVIGFCRKGDVVESDSETVKSWIEIGLVREPAAKRRKKKVVADQLEDHDESINQETDNQPEVINQQEKPTEQEA